MKKILCMILAAMMIASVSVNAVEVDEEVNDIEVVETVEDMPDEDVAEVADVDEPEDTPDEAPADLEDLPDLEDPVIDEPEDYPDADPDDEIVPVVLAAYNGSYKINTWTDFDNNIQWKYEDGVLTFRIKPNSKSDGVIPCDSALGLGISWVAPWEELIGQGRWVMGGYVDITTDDDLLLNKIVFEEGITELPSMGFNLLRGSVIVEIPKSMYQINDRAFDGWTSSDKVKLKCTVNYHGSADDWEDLTKRIGDNNTALTLGATEYFNMYIPDTIELTNAKPTWGESIIYQSNINNIGTTLTWSDKTYTNEDSIKNPGKKNTCTLSADIRQQQVDGVYTGYCTISVPSFSEDYQDYTCTATLTFNFSM